MPLFRKRETYNEQMLRESGLDRVVFNTPERVSEPETIAPVQIRRPPSSGVPAEWDTTTTADVPGIEGDRVAFVVLPSSDLIVETEQGDAGLSPLADAIEEHIEPPYRAVASRQDGDLWGVGATRIEVATFAFPNAETLVFSQSHGVREMIVDGEPSDVTPPVGLKRLSERTVGDFCVQAQRIDGDYWEVKVSPL